jgi:hypothetical protein
MNPLTRKRHLEIELSSPLLNLPNDVFGLIFTYLKKKRDISSVFLSCKRFQKIIDQWPKDFVQPYVENCSFKTTKDIAFVNKFAPRLDTFALKNVKRCQLSQIANLADKVTHIRLKGFHIGFPFIASNTFILFTNLVSLDLKETFMGTAQTPLPESLKKLRTSAYQISNLILPKGLKRLKVLGRPAAHHYPSFKNLESIQICTIDKFAFSLSPCPLTEFKSTLNYDYSSSSCDFTVPYHISKRQGENPIFQLGECIYEGPLVDYFPCGEGLLKHNGKVVFQGLFKEGIIVSGQGSLILKNAAISNFWTDTVTVRHHNGSLFTGNFNGEGIMTDPFGRFFKGIFQLGEPFTGCGFIPYGNEWYEGHLVEGKFQGFGRIHSNGALYEGYFENNKPVGSFLVIMPGRPPFKTNHPNIQ